MLMIRSITTVPVLLAALLVVTAFSLSAIWDFSAFLLGLIFLPLLFILALASIAPKARWEGSSVDLWLALALAFLSPFAAYAASNIWDRLRFAGWILEHRTELQSAIRKDGIIIGWASWGMAGSQNDSYLVSARTENLLLPAEAEQWRKDMRLECPIVDAHLMWPHIYLVSTYNCPFNGVAVPLE